MKKNFMLVFLLSIIFLSLSVNFSLPYEQDQGSKAAKIVLMVKTNNLLQPVTQPMLYREDMFSFYFILSALLYKFIPENIFTFMNGFSVIIGVIFLCSITLLLKLTLDINMLLSWFLFISMPVVTTTFLYGNEVAMSFAFFALSLLLLSLKFKFNWFLSVLALSASIFSRPDILLLIPFWTGWNVIFYSRLDDDCNFRSLFFDLFKCLNTLFVICLIYFFLVIHSIPKESLSFPFDTNIKLFLSYITYPFNLSIVLIGSLGIIQLFRKSNKLGIVVTSSILPLFFYFQNLSSPKYIFGLAFLFGIPAAFLINNLKFKYKLLPLGMIALWYLVSITPYGIYLFNQGAGIYIPTADGAIPSGSYLWFYKNNSRGFYELKYKSEIESFRAAEQYINTSPDPTVVVGLFNSQFVYYGLVITPISNNMRVWYKQKIYMDIFPEGISYHYLMLQRSYLSMNKMSPDIRGKFITYLSEGRVQALGKEEQPFPSVIEIGPSLPFGNDYSLAKRILFAAAYYQENAILQSNIHYPYYLPTYWIRSTKPYRTNLSKLLYRDDQWMAAATEVQDSQPWILELPMFYLSEKDPNR